MLKSLYVCTNCGASTSKWYGRCPTCGEWNTLEENTIQVNKKSKATLKADLNVDTVPLSQVTGIEEIRYTTGNEELDRVLGGGIVKGSVVLLGGEPGSGKSTLLLQMCGNICEYSTVLYVSGEESARQIKLRANRLGVNSDNLLIANETNIEKINSLIQNEKPDLCIIDSIQTMEIEGVTSSAGSLVQVRECASALTRTAKSFGIPIFIIGHVNKDGAIAGPKVMEHIVDTVMYIEGDRYLALRVLRCVKNRFGSTNEIGIFDMTDKGLIPVSNPSLALLEGRNENLSGSCLTCIMEGTRPVLAEIQSLTSKTAFSVPRRTSDGYDYNRLNLIIAVLEKRSGYYISALDVYLNVTGGIRLDETASDLAVAISIVSSILDKTLADETVAFGEIGLGGEVRSVRDAHIRVKELEKLGFKRCILPHSNLIKLNKKDYNIELIGISNVKEIVKLFK